MKKIVFSLAALALVFSFAYPAYAADCDPSCPSNGDPGAVVQVWGLTGHQTPTLAPGQSVTDEGGIVDTCPVFYSKFMCADISRTDYYRTAMISTARQMVSHGYTATQFPSWAGWLAKVQ